MVNKKNVRLGIIGSSGGGVLAASVECLRGAGKEFDLSIICDRECGMLHWARSNGYNCTLIEYFDAVSFSKRSLDWFVEQGVDNIVLFYTRLVASPLIDDIGVFNVHPSLLPSFPGINAVGMALDAGVRVMGGTLHYVDEGMDTGPIVAQVATGLPPDISLEKANKISFLQKTYLTLLWYELLESDSIAIESPTQLMDISVSPAIRSNEIRAQFEQLQIKEHCRVI